MDKKNGFTLIEVILVLAIAGLIFALTFTALPALWASERDSERRDDVLKLAQQLQNFQTNNNRGALPTLTTGEQSIVNAGQSVKIAGDSIVPSSALSDTSWSGFYRGYFGEDYSDPDGPRYNWLIMSCNKKTPDTPCPNNDLNKLANSSFPNEYNVYIVIGATCSGETAVASANNRKVAILYRLEGGGVHCSNT